MFYKIQLVYIYIPLCSFLIEQKLPSIIINVFNLPDDTDVFKFKF